MKDRKEQIYELASHLFQRKGYKATSMRDLADEVGIKASSLYSHIGSKEEILQKICLENAEVFTAGILEIDTDEHSPLEKIQALLQLHIQVALDNPSSVTVFNDEWKHLSSPYIEQFLQLRKNYELTFLRIIEEAMSLGELKILHPEIVLYTILNAVRWLHYNNIHTGNISPVEIEKDIMTILVEGCKK